MTIGQENVSCPIIFNHYILFAHSLANLQFPILAWEDGSTSLTTRFSLVEPGVHAVFDQTVIQRADSVTVCMGVAEACPEPVEGKTLRGRFSVVIFLNREAREER
jgi:hypothetical protein